MLKNIDQPSERIADVESPHPPWLIDRAILDGEAAGDGAPMHLLEIVDFD